jgi:hypothetical protein
LVSNEIVLPAQNFSGTRQQILSETDKIRALLLPYVDLIPKALLGQFGRDTSAEKEKYRREREKNTMSFFNTLGIKRNSFASAKLFWYAAANFV